MFYNRCMSIEGFPGYNPETMRIKEKELEIDKNPDERREDEVFADHERLKQLEEDAVQAMARESLAEESDGVLRLTIADYDYPFEHNPFVGMGSGVVRVYQIARYLDVTFLHRFMYHDILVTAVSSYDYVKAQQRGGFVKRIKETGGSVLRIDESKPYDFRALRFSPYVASDTTLPFFERFHKNEPHASKRPHHPLDVWLVYDAKGYDDITPKNTTPTMRTYALKKDYDRPRSLLAVAQIN